MTFEPFSFVFHGKATKSTHIFSTEFFAQPSISRAYKKNIICKDNFEAGVKADSMNLLTKLFAVIFLIQQLPELNCEIAPNISETNNQNINDDNHENKPLKIDLTCKWNVKEKIGYNNFHKFESVLRVFKNYAAILITLYILLNTVNICK